MTHHYQVEWMRTFGYMKPSRTSPLNNSNGLTLNIRKGDVWFAEAVVPATSGDEANNALRALVKQQVGKDLPEVTR